ncbi:MAG: NADH-quinone oxidoreductase subunit C [Alphaproteobacteria bacterium]|jgi:NADH-quinone oxidoreductase subunit C|nr:NADH-quinone oxidoreductase subunit C [Alphaproteobacteria bacterium]
MSEASENYADLAAHLEQALKGAFLGHRVAHGELTVRIDRDKIIEAVKFLREDRLCLFETLIDICGVDYPERAERFDVVYHFLSMRMNHRIRLKVATDEDTPVASLTGLFPGADWFEREAFDMYGIQFSNHPDLRRILTDYGFEGYPLRKDFPLTGHVEVRWDDLEKRVVYEPVQLTQEYRNFDFLSPWEGMTSVIPGDEKADTNEEGA